MDKDGIMALVVKVLQKLCIRVTLFVISFEHSMPLAKQPYILLLDDFHYVRTVIFMHKVFNLQICPTIYTLFKRCMNIHSCNTRIKDVNFYLNHADNRISKYFITFHEIVPWNS